MEVGEPEGEVVASGGGGEQGGGEVVDVVFHCGLASGDVVIT